MAVYQGKSTIVWIEALKNRDPEVRAAAIDALVKIGMAAVPDLVDALGDPNVDIVSGTAQALGRIGMPARSALPALHGAMKHRLPEVRSDAAFALAKISNDALLKALAATEATVRAAAVEALGRLGGEVRDCIKLLLAALQDSDLIVREAAIQSLGRLGPAAVEALPTLIGMARTADSRIRPSLFLALGGMGPQAVDAVPVLVDALDVEGFRGAAARALAGIGPAAKPAVPKLKNMLADPSLRYIAAGAMVTIGADASSTVPVLIEGLADARVREACVEFLGRVGWAARPAVERGGGVGGGGGGPPPARPAVEPLSALLKHEDPRVRTLTAKSLGLIGPAAKPALGALRKLVKSKDEAEKQAALEALDRINPKARLGGGSFLDKMLRRA